MGSSNRKKAKKNEDFQKPKLKVGKSRPKPTNFTDTSFRSKGIVLPSQSLQTDAPSSAAQFRTHLSLLSSRSADQRVEHLRALTTHVGALGHALPVPPAEILVQVRNLVLDSSNQVRAQLLKLLPLLPHESIGDAVFDLLLRIRAGMTHISPDIRNSSIALLSCLLDVVPNALLACAGGFIKTLKTLYTLLNWTLPDGVIEQSKGWISHSSTNRVVSASGTKVQLQVLASLLRLGLLPSKQINASVHTPCHGFPMVNASAHMLQGQSNALASLNLFGSSRDVDGEVYECVEDRQRVWNDLKMHQAAECGVKSLAQEGGDIGRAAGEVFKALKDIAVAIEEGFN